MSEVTNNPETVEFGTGNQLSEETGRHIVTLEANHEWRFEVGFDGRMLVRLIEGSAELFGTELAKGREYEFTGQNAAVFTYQGCKLEWEGDCNEYTAANAMMGRYVNLHFAIEKMRLDYEKQKLSQPPKIMIVGPRNSGKSTLTKVLVSYATKLGRFPLLVNIDPMNPVFSPPGSLIAAPVSHILDIEDGFGLSPISGPAATHHKQPLVYNFGLQDPIESPGFYQHLISYLASGISSRLNEDNRVRNSGVIVDTPSSFSDIDDEEKLRIVAHCVSELNISAILVIGKERLTSKLQKLLQANERQTQVLNIPLSGGITEDDDAFTRQTQRKAISEYFFGSSRQSLSPFTVTVPLQSIVVYRPLEQNEIGTDDSEYLMRVESSAVLQNCLLAVVNAEPTDPPSVVASAETLGYVHIVEADETKKILKILLPVPGGVPRKAFIMGSFRYHE